MKKKKMELGSKLAFSKGIVSALNEIEKNHVIGGISISECICQTESAGCETSLCLTAGCR